MYYDYEPLHDLSKFYFFSFLSFCFDFFEVYLFTLASNHIKLSDLSEVCNLEAYLVYLYYLLIVLLMIIACLLPN